MTSLVHQARVMRSQGMSIRAISSELGVPRATLGDWLKGTAAQPSYTRVCFICGASFAASRSHAKQCGRHNGTAWKKATSILRAQGRGA